MDSPVTIDSSIAAFAFHNDAIDRHFLARSHPQLIAGLHLVEWNVFFSAVISNYSGGFRSQPQQRLDGRAGLAAGLQFQHLPQQNQGGDDGRRFKINSHRALFSPEGGREYFGEDCRDQTVDVGNRHAQSNQGEHIEIPGYDRLPAPHQKWPAAPEHDRCRQQQFDPDKDILRDYPCQWVAGNHVAHGQNKNRQRKDQADPESAAHVGQFGVFFLLTRLTFWFQGHAAFRATAGPVLQNLRVHGTGPKISLFLPAVSFRFITLCKLFMLRTVS